MLLKTYETYILSYLPHLFAALLILIVGITIASILKRFLKHGMKIKNDEILITFLTNLVFSVVLVITIIMTLGKLGVPTATLITLLGAGSLAIGFALKDFLSNIAAGFLIIFLRPFKIGDFIVVNGNSGTIININLFLTQLKSSSNECIFIPNNGIIVNPITNQSFYKLRRLDIEIGVGYETDLQKAKNLLETMLSTADFVVQSEQPVIGVANLADSSIIMLVRFWVLTENYTIAKHKLLEAVKQKFSEENISLPFPQLDLHLKKENGSL